MKDKKQLARMANRIREGLMQLRLGRYVELNRQMTTLIDRLHQLTSESRKMKASVARSWLCAAQRCCAGLSRLLGEVDYSLPRIRSLAEKPQKETAKLPLLIDELDGLQKEFGDIEFDASKNTISAVTESIMLDGIYLGPFKIQLELNKLDQLYYSSPYLVIALEPNPAATNDSVTHPHVSDERLCEGEGSTAIRTALEEGRIGDFFTLVRSILNTYSPDSPYVSLDNWDGTTCYDCGYTMSSEDTYFCPSCEHDYCPDCSTYCRRCEETVCLGCSGQCAYCEEMLCRNCVSACEECGKLFCESCLKDDLCPNCTEEQEQEDEQEESTINESETASQPQAGTTEIELAS
ncbi:MAG: hypothetical protein ACYS14_13735 [Planctomycetota bacterium]|jgi:hypothetical protein